MKTVLIFALLLLSHLVSAQSRPTDIPAAGSDKLYTLLLKDGSVVSGRIVKRDSINLVVRQRNGRLTYVDLELFDRVIENNTASLPAPAGTGVPVATTNTPLSDSNMLRDYIIRFRDGTQVRGAIVRRDSTTLVIRKRNGALTYADPLLLEAVEEPEPVLPENSFAPFMTLNQTAYTADPGHLYYRNVLLFFNELTLGLSRNWSVGASVVPAAWFLSEVYVPSVSFSTKVSFPLGKLARVGVSAAYQPSRTYDQFKQNEVWNVQAMASIGDSQRNITLGYGRSSSDHDKLNRQPYFTMSALLKVSPTVSFITDNTLYTNQNRYFISTASFFSAAIRLDRPRHTFDLGVLGQTFVINYYQGRGANPQFFPYLAYTVRI